MLSPVEGEVVAVNHSVLHAPEILCSDPYGQGWLVEVRVPEHKRSQKNLLCGGLARAWMEVKVRDLRARASPTPELELGPPDPGVRTECRGFARVLAPENWEEVAGELLLIED
jgi:hypothetical protein